MKPCFKCGTIQPLDRFYANSHMADGRSNKCKACTLADMRATRAKRIDHYREYDRTRAKLPHRKARIKQASDKWYREDTRRQKAHSAAKLHHRTAPDACQACGLHKRLERHHPDYNLPRLIEWLCKPCHCKADKARREREGACAT